MWIGLIGMLWAVLAVAHPMPESRVWIDTTPSGLRLTLQLPLNRLEYGFGQPLADLPGTVLARHSEALSRYLLRHVAVRSYGRSWQASPPQLTVVGTNASAELEAVMDLRAPDGAGRHAPRWCTTPSPTKSAPIVSRCSCAATGPAASPTSRRCCWGAEPWT